MELCRFLGISPVLFTSGLPRIIKHPYLLIRTYLVIRTKRPRTLIVQNPSLLLTLMACLLRKRFKYKLVVDAHNAGLTPESVLLKYCTAIYRYLQRAADMTVVTNRSLAESVKRNKGLPFELPDKLPEPPKVNPLKPVTKHNVVYVCTFGPDEPYKHVLTAAESISDGITIYVTGNHKRLRGYIMQKPSEKVVFTGYLQELDYWSLLYSADLVMDLTVRENCLVCAAYEAISVGTPLILSDTEALRKYFYKGALFTANRSDEIRRSIWLGLKDVERLKGEICELRTELEKKWIARGSCFRKIIGA